MTISAYELTISSYELTISSYELTSSSHVLPINSYAPADDKKDKAKGSRQNTATSKGSRQTPAGSDAKGYMKTPVERRMESKPTTANKSG